MACLHSALGYISTVDGSGGTELPNLNRTVGAVAGRLLVFHNTYPGTATKHADALHAGLPVGEGEKWAFNLWFHDRPVPTSVEAAKRRERKRDGEAARPADEL